MSEADSKQIDEGYYNDRVMGPEASVKIQRG
jgi:hypothetical protein